MARKVYGDSFQLGILGGGQLGRMFIQEAINFDVHVHILDGDIKAPCSAIAHTFVQGDITDYQAVYDFGITKDVLTVEIENVNIEALYKLEEEGVKIFPQPRVLEIIKDKGLQKQFYTDNNLPTAPFQIDNSPEHNNLKEQIPFVQKLRTGGYDGKGVQVIRNVEELSFAFSEPSVLEELIPFEKELSVIVARNESGETAVYPSVECEFGPTNLVEFLFSPAEVSEAIEVQSKELAVAVINALDMVGILAVEMFLTREGKLLINEIAPRPHNSGHHTIECNITSQFEQHMRAVLNLPLGATDMTSAGAMINLIGEKGYSGPVYYEGLTELLKVSGLHPHLYGKAETKPNRKMGHITLTGKDLKDVKAKASHARSSIRVISLEQ